MNTSEVIKRILDVAVCAPSGDNAQPWQFGVNGDTISVFNISNRDETIYNFCQRGSYVGHGALVENILITSRKEGLEGTVTAFPGDKDCTACISLSSSSPYLDPLYDAIAQRTTNRKPYKKRAMSAEDKAALEESIRRFSNTEMRLVENREVLDKLAVTLSLNERLLMENRELHDFLFGMIRWTHKEELRNPGLYVKTMEFPAPIRLLLKFLLCRWPIVRVLNKIGLSRAISKQSSQLYGSSSAFGAIIIRDKENSSFLEAGRAFQRLWLTATRLGLSLQPVTAIPYLAQRIRESAVGMFSEEHIILISKANLDISSAFNLEGRSLIAMLFRIGYDGQPTARSAKIPPIVL